MLHIKYSNIIRQTSNIYKVFSLSGVCHFYNLFKVNPCLKKTFPRLTAVVPRRAPLLASVDVDTLHGPATRSAAGDRRSCRGRLLVNRGRGRGGSAVTLRSRGRGGGVRCLGDGRRGVVVIVVGEVEADRGGAAVLLPLPLLLLPLLALGLLVHGDRVPGAVLVQDDLVLLVGQQRGLDDLLEVAVHHEVGIRTERPKPACRSASPRS